jgi:hypothetical protein
MISIEVLTNMVMQAIERREIAKSLFEQAESDVKMSQETLQMALRYYEPESVAAETRKKNRELNGIRTKKEICLDYLFDAPGIVRVDDVCKGTQLNASTVRNALCEAVTRGLCVTDGLGNYWVDR